MRKSMCRPLLLLALFLVLMPAPVHAASRHHSRQIVVVLDPGHGGDDIGAADSSQTLVEKTLNLEVARSAERDLSAMGYRVYLTRTGDHAVNVPPRDLNIDGKVDQADEFVARNLFANRHHADVLVSMHFDASPIPDSHGTHGYYCPARPFWRSSRRLATLLTASISRSLTRSGFASPNDGVMTDVADVVAQERSNYPWFLVLGPSMKHFVIASQMPGALIESLYLSSPRDVAGLHRRSTIAALGQGYANGIRAYFDGHTHR